VAGRPSGGMANGLRPAILPPGRLDRLVRRLTPLLRKAHLTAAEAAYVWRRARAKAGIGGRPTTPKRLPEILTLEEFQRILAEAYRADPRDGLLLRLLFESAVRVSELSHLEVPDVEFGERTLRVRQGKGAKDRLVLCTPDLGQLLQVHLGGRTRGPLFISNRGARLSVRRIQSIVRNAAWRAGIQKKISPHSLRHTWATMARNAGLPLDTVQLLLGHASPRTTELYSRLSMATAREEYDRAMRALASPSGRGGAGPASSVERHAALGP
jgi:integrase/recombinase XerD